MCLSILDTAHQIHNLETKIQIVIDNYHTLSFTIIKYTIIIMIINKWKIMGVHNKNENIFVEIGSSITTKSLSLSKLIL